MSKYNKLEVINKGSYEICANCGGLVLDEESHWLGEDANGVGWAKVYQYCDKCGRRKSYKIGENGVIINANKGA